MAEPTFVKVQDLMKMLRIGKSTAYKLMSELNAELKEKGYKTFAGRVPRSYVIKRCVGA